MYRYFRSLLVLHCDIKVYIVLVCRCYMLMIALFKDIPVHTSMCYTCLSYSTYSTLLHIGLWPTKYFEEKTHWAKAGYDVEFVLRISGVILGDLYGSMIMRLVPCPCLVCSHVILYSTLYIGMKSALVELGQPIYEIFCIIS